MVVPIHEPLAVEVRFNANPGLHGVYKLV